MKEPLSTCTLRKRNKAELIEIIRNLEKDLKTLEQSLSKSNDNYIVMEAEARANERAAFKYMVTSYIKLKMKSDPQSSYECEEALKLMNEIFSINDLGSEYDIMSSEYDRQIIVNAFARFGKWLKMNPSISDETCEIIHNLILMFTDFECLSSNKEECDEQF